MDGKPTQKSSFLKPCLYHNYLMWTLNIAVSSLQKLILFKKHRSISMKKSKSTVIFSIFGDIGTFDDMETEIKFFARIFFGT